MDIDYLEALNFGIIILSLFDTFLFLYWWMKLKRATTVYVYVLLLIFSLGIENILELSFRIRNLDYIRSEAYHGYKTMTELLSLQWTLKEILVFTALLFFTIHMSSRIYFTRFKLKGFKTEIEKNRKKDASYQVLIIEDNPMIPGMIANYLKIKNSDIGLSVKTSAEEALEHMESNPVDLILCDINLDGKMNGFQLVEKIKEKYPLVINIGITGFPWRYPLDVARRNGFDDYFLKPFRISDIVRSIDFHREKTERWRLFNN